MYPILGRYGPFFLYSFTVVIGLGILAALGLAYVTWPGRRRGQRWPGWIDGLMLALAAALIGGRIGYVWANWGYFEQHPVKIGLVWRGGLSYHGALLAGLVVFWLWCRRQEGNAFAAYADQLAPGLALGTLFGWAACWFDGCGYGRETYLSLLAADLPDDFGVYGLRYQTQLLAMGLSLLILLLALWWQRRPATAPGSSFWLTLVALSGGRFLISLLRGDPVPMAGPWRIDTLLDGFLVLAALAPLIGALWSSNLKK